MVTEQVQRKANDKNERAKRSIALAMQGNWAEAALVNQSILSDFPDDMESYNRLGKALTELGRIQEAKEAFGHALEISPHNTIAKKNLGRLVKMGDEALPGNTITKKAAHAFIEESGKTGVTSLLNLAKPAALSKMSPGHPVDLEAEGKRLKAMSSAGEYLGQVEPRLSSRLTRLMSGGNRYEATVTSANEAELTIIIREAYEHPSQAGTVSFPSRGGPDLRVYLPGTILGSDSGEEGAAEAVGGEAMKDWSDDDTEPGDDEGFSPVLHRVISASGDGPGDQDD